MNTQSAEQRAYERTSVCWPGTIVGDDVMDDCVVCNFSQGGAMVTSSKMIPINHPVTLKVPQVGVFVGTVAWRKSDRLGLSFMHLDNRSASRGESGEKSSPGISLIGLDPFSSDS